MNKRDEQAKREPEPGSTAILRVLIALSVGLLLGFLGSHLFGQQDWSSPLFLLLTPLLLGMLGMLTVRARKKRLITSGFGTGGLLWFGVWVAVLGWKLPQPQTIMNCSFPDGPCGSATASFWDAYAGSGLVVFLVFLAWGLALVVMSAAIMESVMASAQRRGNKPKAL